MIPRLLADGSQAAASGISQCPSGAMTHVFKPHISHQVIPLGAGTGPQGASRRIETPESRCRGICGAPCFVARFSGFLTPIGAGTSYFPMPSLHGSLWLKTS